MDDILVDTLGCNPAVCTAYRDRIRFLRVRRTRNLTKLGNRVITLVDQRKYPVVCLTMQPPLYIIDQFTEKGFIIELFVVFFRKFTAYLNDLRTDNDQFRFRKFCYDIPGQ